jgi:hypothetical protein
VSDDKIQPVIVCFPGLAVNTWRLWVGCLSVRITGAVNLPRAEVWLICGFAKGRDDTVAVAYDLVALPGNDSHGHYVAL